MTPQKYIDYFMSLSDKALAKQSSFRRSDFYPGTMSILFDVTHDETTASLTVILNFKDGSTIESVILDVYPHGEISASEYPDLLTLANRLLNLNV